MNLIQCFQTHSTWYKGAIRGSKPVGILWHDTAGGNPTLKRYVQPYAGDKDYDKMIALLGKNKYNNDWNHIDHKSGLNAWIGQLADGSIATVQAGEWDITPWGCGSGSKGSCNGYIKNSNGSTAWINEHWIQFEICDDGYRDESYFKKVYKEACEFTAYICKLYNIDPKGTHKFNGVDVPTILCHADSYKLGVGGNHGDIYLWFKKFGYTMDNVREDVAALVGKKDESVEPTPTPTREFIKGDLVKIIGTNYYSGNKAIPTWVKQLNWYVMQSVGDRVVLGEDESKKYNIASAVKASDLQLIKAFKEEPKKKEVYSGVPSNGSDEYKKKFWDFFLADFKNEYSVAGLMGNIYAKSALVSDNLDNAFNKSLNMSDKVYTTQVDSGEYANFIHDSAGYGLAQWTHRSRKEAFYNYCQECKKSIGDFETQMAFLLKELKEQYKSLYKSLIASKSVREASNLILLNYEASASKDAKETQDRRNSYSEKFFEMFGTKVKPQPKPDDNKKEDEVKPIPTPDPKDEVKPIPTPDPKDEDQKDNELKDEEALSWIIKLFRLIFNFFKDIFTKKEHKETTSETPAAICNIEEPEFEDDFCEYSEGQ